jgi:hypothetical protein
VKAFRRTALALFTACTLPMIAFSAAAQDAFLFTIRLEREIQSI